LGRTRRSSRHRWIFFNKIAAFGIRREVVASANPQSLGDAVRGKELVVFIKHDVFNDTPRAKVESRIAART
jgi:hypothetical protein